VDEQAQIETAVSMGEALGQSEVFLEFQDRLSRVARINRPVLLIGERGTGKELAASRLHFLSERWKGPLVALNCSAMRRAHLPGLNSVASEDLKSHMTVPFFSTK